MKPRSETVTLAYALPPGADIRVSVGDRVREDDLIAEAPATPRIIAVAAELRLGHDASREMMHAIGTRTVAAGTELGSRRSGLRTRTVRAPDTGNIQALPDYGAVIARPSEGRAEYRARHPGVIASIDAGCIAVVSRVVRRRFAFAIGSQRDLGHFSASAGASGHSTRTDTRVSAAATTVTAFAHIGDVAEITDLLSAASGPLIVGTVSDSVAWALLTRAPSQRRGPEYPVLVLLGPGDEEQGAAALLPLRRYDGMAIIADHHAREMVIFPDDPTENADDPLTRENYPTDAVYMDPSHWLVPCVVGSEVRVGLLNTQRRAVVVSSTDGRVTDERTPVANLGNRAGT